MNWCPTRVATMVMGAVLAGAAIAGAGPLQDDLAARRARLMERLGTDTVAIVWSAPSRVYSRRRRLRVPPGQQPAVSHRTRPSPRSVLVLIPGAKTVREVLFVREPNARREHREGHTLTKAEVTAQSGVDTVYFVSEFEPFITALFNRRVYGLKRNEVSTEFDTFFEAVAGQPRQARAAVRAAPGAVGAADRAVRVRREGARPLPERRVRRYVPAHRRPPTGQDALRADAS